MLQMFKKHIIFSNTVHYIILGPLCPASLKHAIFYKAPPSDKRLSALIGQLTQSIVMSTTSMSRKWNAHFHNREL